EHSHMLFCIRDTGPADISTLSLHDALPISSHRPDVIEAGREREDAVAGDPAPGRFESRDSVCRGRQADRPAGVRAEGGEAESGRDRKSTRLNSSHVKISYAVFCLKKKKKTE